MAKHSKAPPPEDDDEVETTTHNDREPAGPSRTRWFLSRLLVMLALLGVLVYFAPAVVCQPVVWKTGLSFAAPELKDRVQIGKLSLGWFSPIRIEKLVLKDAQGNTLADVANLSSSKPLYALALNSNDLGKFIVNDPKAVVVLRTDGSNWEDFLNQLPQSEPKPDDGKPGAPLQFQLELVRGQVLYDDQIAGKQWQLDGITAQVDWPAAVDQPRTGKLSAGIRPAGEQPSPIPQGDLQVDFAWQPSAAGLGAGKVQLQSNSFALDVAQGALRRAGVDLQAAGVLSTALQYEFARDAQDHQLHLQKLNIPSLALASGTFLGADQPRLAIESGQGQVQLAGGKLTVVGLDIRSNLAQLSGNGQANIGDLNGSANLGADTQLQVQAQVDLAAVAAQLPATLHLKNDTQISSGRLNVGLVSRNESTGRLWQAGLQADNLVAQAGGRQVRWEDPLKLDAVARQTAAGLTIETLSGKARFFDLNGSGTLTKGELTANADLNRLVAELEQFVDFGDIRLAGTMDAKLAWQQTAGEQWQATADTTVQQLVLEAPGMVPWREDHLKVIAQVNGRISGTNLEQISQATLNVDSSADKLEANLTKPVDHPGLATAWPLRFTVKGDLATWQPRLQAFVPLAGWRTAGGIDLQGAGNFSPETTELQTGKLQLTRLAVSGPGLAISEPQVVLETSGSWNQKDLTFTSTATTLASSAIALRAENVKAVLGGATPTVQGVIDYRGDMARLMTWLPAAEPRPYQVTGMLEGRLEAALRGGKVEAVWNNDIKDLKYASPETPQPGAHPATLVSGSTAGQLVIRHEEPLVKIVAQASYDPATDVLTLSRAQLQSSMASLNADGSVNELTKRCVANVQGQVAYDLAVLSQLFNDKMRQSATVSPGQRPQPTSPLLTAELTGKETRRFAVRGPLLATGDQAGALVSSELTADAEFGWQSAKYAGLVLGPGAVPAKLDKSLLQIGPLDLTINEGKIVGAPRVNLATATPVLEMDKGPFIQNLRISPELCDGWMKFVAPLLAGVTRAEGNFSVDLEGAKVPLTQPTVGSIGGIMTIHRAEVGPGPLAQSYLTVAKQLKDIADGNYAAVANLFAPNAAGATADTGNSKGVLVLPEQQVKFEMIEGRVHHQGLKMTVKDVIITTRGSVGLDQTMELVAEIPVQESWLKNNSALASLKGQTLQIPIRGTLSQPAPDLRAISNLTQGLARNAATNALQDRATKEINKFLPGFNPNAFNPNGVAPNGIAPNGIAPGGVAPGTAPAQPGAAPTQPAPFNPLNQLQRFIPQR
jgi:translocation and assembly module TamB